MLWGDSALTNDSLSFSTRARCKFSIVWGNNLFSPTLLYTSKEKVLRVQTVLWIQTSTTTTCRILISFDTAVSYEGFGKDIAFKAGENLNKTSRATSKSSFDSIKHFSFSCLLWTRQLVVCIIGFICLCVSTSVNSSQKVLCQVARDRPLSMTRRGQSQMTFNILYFSTPWIYTEKSVKLSQGCFVLCQRKKTYIFSSKN